MQADRLSPEPHAPRPVGLPWGLTWKQLWSCTPFSGRPVAAFATHRIRGLHREDGSQILTITFEQLDGQTQGRTIFLKRTARDRPEAAKYRWLMARNVGVPELLGTVSTSAGEIIILEFLATIGTTVHQADVLLNLIADVNSVKDPPADIFTPLAGDPEHCSRIRHALGELLPPVTKADVWLDAYRRSAERVDQMPLELNHNELGFQQVGWTTGSATDRSRLVTFDLETMSMRPQYTDIAGLLAPLASQTNRSEAGLFHTYLAATERRTGRPTKQHEAWNSMRIVRIVRTFEALPWLITMVNAPEVETAERAVTRLSRDLSDLDLLA